jgi:hypothetical protein
MKGAITMAETTTISIDVINMTIPIGNHKMIPIINQPNPCYGYEIDEDKLFMLIQLSNYKITESGTNIVIDGNNFYDYFPKGGGGSGGVTPEQVNEMIEEHIDSSIDDTSTNAIQNAVITNFVNSSIESSTADFKGTFQTKAEMDAVTANKNDYAFLIVDNYNLLTEEPASFDPTNYYKLVDGEYVPGEAGDVWAADTWYEDDGTVNHYERYKWVEPAVDDSNWLYEYDLNNSSYTAEQWAAINSGIKSGDVEKIHNAMMGLSSGTTENDIVLFGVTGKTVKDSGVSIETTMTDSDYKVPTSKSIKSNTSKTAVLTDYVIKSESAAIQPTDTINDAFGKVEKGVSEKITSSDYATQEVGGTVRTWTTVESGKTTLHISTEDPLPPQPIIVSRQVRFDNLTYPILPVEEDIELSKVYSKINRCNVTDDGEITAFYGDSNYTEDGSNGQVMVYIPKFWYKMTPVQLNESKLVEANWEICDIPQEGYTLHPAFYDANGDEIDYFLFGAFEAVGQNTSGTYGSYNTTNDRLSSVGGNIYAPVSDLTRATARTMAANRGTGWYLESVKQIMAIQMLFVVEYGVNSQDAVGLGICNSANVANVGQTTGNITYGTHDNKTTPVNWRGIENLWGNIYGFIDGINFNGRVPYICDNFTFVDDTSTGYTQISFNIGLNTSSELWIDYFGYDENNDWIFIPQSCSYPQASMMGDSIFAKSSGWNIISLGGRWTNDNKDGIFFYAAADPSSYKSANAGARLMYIPTAN